MYEGRTSWLEVWALRLWKVIEAVGDTGWSSVAKLHFFFVRDVSAFFMKRCGE